MGTLSGIFLREKADASLQLFCCMLLARGVDDRRYLIQSTSPIIQCRVFIGNKMGDRDKHTNLSNTKIEMSPISYRIEEQLKFKLQ